jgi:LmbE family N-acetylglucosaminyl deacetylase
MNDQHGNRTNAGAIAQATAYTTVGNVLMPLARPLPRRLLGVWAHPDDEAYLSAGLMARVAATGGEVTVLTATRGEKGTSDPDRYDRPAFADEREEELRASLGMLGVHDVRFMGLRDGECDLADPHAAIATIEAVIGEVDPDMIVTFGPDGITNHPDHRAVSRWTTEAWRRHGRGELLYATMTHDYVRRHEDLHQRLGIFEDFGGRGPRSVAQWCVQLECALTERELDLKRAALAAHASQTAPLVAMMGEDTYRSWWSEETFRAPTAAEIAACPLPAWMERFALDEPMLVGAPS